MSDPKLRKVLSMYRLSQHNLTIETGRHRQTWLPKEDRLCPHSTGNEVETELHFLTSCPKYAQIREREGKGSGVWPSMVTHTRNLSSAFNPSKCTLTAVNTHPEQWAAMLRRPGSSWGIGALLKGLTSVVVLKVERALVIHSPHRQFLPDLGIEPATFGLQVQLSNHKATAAPVRLPPFTCPREWGHFLSPFHNSPQRLPSETKYRQTPIPARRKPSKLKPGRQVCEVLSRRKSLQRDRTTNTLTICLEALL